MTQPARPNVLIGSCGAVDVLHLSDFLAAFGRIAASTRVILTGAAQRFVTVDAVEALTRNTVATDEHRGDVLVPHINLPAWADLFVVVPATANILAKAAHGIADDLLSTTILAASAGLLRPLDERRDVADDRPCSGTWRRSSSRWPPRAARSAHPDGP